MSKGSKPRPLSVDTKTFDDNWATIFKKKCDNTDTAKNQYQDLLDTESCIIDALELDKK